MSISLFHKANTALVPPYQVLVDTVSLGSCTTQTRTPISSLSLADISLQNFLSHTVQRKLPLLETMVRPAHFMRIIAPLTDSSPPARRWTASTPHVGPSLPTVSWPNWKSWAPSTALRSRSRVTSGGSGPSARTRGMLSRPIHERKVTS